MRVTVSWLYLALAIVCEIAGTTALKLSNGFTRLAPAVAVVVLYGISFTLLSLALKQIDVGVAYAVWSGVGTALIATIGVLAFKEPVTAIKVGCLALIIVGVVGLNLGGGAH
jgi:small multidrug resistance pump